MLKSSAWHIVKWESAVECKPDSLREKAIPQSTSAGSDAAETSS